MKMSTCTNEKKTIEDKNGKHAELVAVAIDEGIGAIGKEYFAGCSNLKVIVFPESVTKIDDAALCDSGIEIDGGTEKIKVILAYCIRGSYADMWLSKYKNKYIKVYYSKESRRDSNGNQNKSRQYKL